MAPSIETPRLESLAKERRVEQWLKSLPDPEKLYPHVLEPWQSLPIDPPKPPPGTVSVNGYQPGKFWKWVGIGAEKRK
jgi:hypothetical protein